MNPQLDVRAGSLRLLALLLAAWTALAPTWTRAEPVDLSTPRRAFRHFLESARTGDYQGAAAVLDLGGIPQGERGEKGPRLARQLAFVLERQVPTDWDELSDEPAGDPADGPGADRLGEVRAGEVRVPIRLIRMPGGDWRIGRATVLATPRLYDEYGPGWIGDVLPTVLLVTRIFGLETWQWLGIAVALALAVLMALSLGALARALGRPLARRTGLTWDGRLLERMLGPGRLLLGLWAFDLIVGYLRLPPRPEAVATRSVQTAVILAVTWTCKRVVDFLADLASESLGQEGAGVGRAQATRTRIMVLRRVAGVVVMVLGGSLVLRQFEGLRAIGTSLLASAGVAGIVIGFAAQKTIGTLLAGLQISLAEPFRVGDVVVMEGEWGIIEEITLTYVVLKVWDQRRLVIPIGRVLETPFQNWSRAGTELLGTVFVHADYRVPVETVRQEMERFARTRPEWDGRVAQLQVTGVTDRTVELRALVSATDSSKAWDLRCALREHLVGFLQQLDGGRHLPRVRVEPERLE